MVMGLTDLKTWSAIGPIRRETAKQNTSTGKTLKESTCEPDVSLGALDTGTALPGDLNWDLTEVH